MIVWKWLLRIAGAIGLALFTTFFVFTFSRPQWIETFAASFIEDQVVEEVGARLAGDPATPLRERLSPALSEQAAQLLRRQQEQIEARLRELLPAALAEIRDPDCSCRKILLTMQQSTGAGWINEQLERRERVKSFIHAGYMTLVRDLEREIRIFTGTTGAAFLFMLLVSFAKPAAARHLLFPGTLLLVATVFCAWMYVFSQNWLLTIVHGDYLGWGYAAYLGLVFAFLCDIGLNRARATCAIGNGISTTFGSAASLSPC